MIIKQNNFAKKRRSPLGFTLVELLVVIAIIATLAAISIPIGMRVFNNAKIVEAKVMMKAYVTGCEKFYKDYGSLTGDIVCGGGVNNAVNWSSSDNPTSYNTAKGVDGAEEFIRSLCGGDDTNTSFYNPRRIVYFRGDDAIIEDGQMIKGGIVRDSGGQSAHGILDPWGNKYLLLFDYDYDGKFTSGSGMMGDPGAYTATINLNGHYGMSSGGGDGARNYDKDAVSWE